MIETLDQSVGRVLQTLDELGIAENTIVILTSDNGGLRSVLEGKKNVTATDNSPARGGKAMLYEGGTRVPLIIKWPGVTRAGSTSDVPVISMDLYPTLLDMAGLPARPSQHRDGLSLAPLLKGTGTLDREALFWHFPHYHSDVATPMGSLRAGDWKLIEFFEDNRIELYNLKDDIGEKQNLAAKQPEKAAELRKRLQDWRASVGAQMPAPNPSYAERTPARAGRTRAVACRQWRLQRPHRHDRERQRRLVCGVAEGMARIERHLRPPREARRDAAGVQSVQPRLSSARTSASSTRLRMSRSRSMSPSRGSPT